MADCDEGGVTQCAHLIDDEGNLLPDKDIQDFVLSTFGREKQKGTLQRIGVDYHVVGVFGGQSSGKSTMLNSLFGTQFQTMDETQRRGQTTKGAFISRTMVGTAQSKHSAQEASAEQVKSADDMLMPLFVLDFEGTDGIERGEDQSFERQLSLFALSVADALIINMWSVDVGRFNAANMSLLRTIFEVNLQLFSHDKYVTEERPILLVVLRDFTENDPGHYFQTIRHSFNKIWGDIVKPELFMGASIDVLFDIRFYVLPHYKLQREEFERSIVEFREWFLTPSCDNFLFRSRGMFRGIPLDGVPTYLSSCWSVIRSSKDLDIPTQREMLAKHRCAEARHNVYAIFKEHCSAYVDNLHSGKLVPNLSKMLECEIDNLLCKFREQTKLYSESVMREVEEKLEEELLAEELKLLGQYAKTIASVVLSGLDISVGNSVDGTVRWLMYQAHSLPLISIKKNEGETKMKAMGDIGGSGGRSEVDESCSVDGAVMDNEKCVALVQRFWSRLCQTLQEELRVLYDQQPEQQSNCIYGRYAVLVAQDPVMRESVVHAVIDALQQKVRYRFAALAENAPETIHQAFEHALTRREDGTVRFFGTTKGLCSAEPQSRQAGLLMLGCLLYYHLKLVPSKAEDIPQGTSNSRAILRLVSERRKLDVCDNSAEKKFFLQYTTIYESPRYPVGVSVSEDESIHTPDSVLNSDCVLLSQQAVQRAFELYLQKCEFTMQLQHRSIENGKQNLPAWVFPVIFLLGWNEMWYILTSPLLLLIIAVVLAVFFRQFVISYWEMFEETGPTWLVLSVRAVMQPLQFFYKKFTPLTSNTVVNGVRYRDPTSSSDVASGFSVYPAATLSSSLRTSAAITGATTSSTGATLTHRANKVKPEGADK